MTAIWYGIESRCERVLRVLKRGIDLERVRGVVEWTEELGVAVGLFFTIGAPGEDIEAVRETVEFVYEAEPDHVHFSIATPYPNTEFWRWVEESGRSLTRDYERFERESVFETPSTHSRID